MSESGISNPGSSDIQEPNSQKPVTITLKSSDGVEFSLPIEIAQQSGMVKSVISEDLFEKIPLPAVSGPVLSKLIEFWENSAKTEEWKDEFFKGMERDLLFGFLTGANYLDCKEALESASEFVGVKIKDFTVENCREYFGVENDFTEEEEERIRKESPWAFE